MLNVAVKTAIKGTWLSIYNNDKSKYAQTALDVFANLKLNNIFGTTSWEKGTLPNCDKMYQNGKN